MILYQFNKQILGDRLQAEIVTAGLTTITHIDTIDDDVYIYFENALTTEQQSILSGLVDSHTPVTSLEAVTAAIVAASTFGGDLMNRFAAENVLMGITSAGKTILVSDYLHRLAHYLSTGSLYAAKEKIDELIGAGVPENLSPFVTEERLLDYKAYIQDYLS